MEKIAKTRSKNKIKGNNIPQLYLKAAKKELVELKHAKISTKKLKFNDSNRHFGNDITNSIKNNAQISNGHHSFHQKSSSVSNKVRKNYLILNFYDKDKYSRNKRNKSF